ncbi:uncharacterized protein (TIGR02246 family) [Actinoalloteichus hoggarensis]|uniref:SnoaL-like domain protein n=1 Tax=Actinoalloteichus hoggarensis TaxID=1470176 RepID=A0A221W4W6_9PSEU|nr:SgcJ/EcaC family oxidoreductase [Actinoalloteichus hoggarensis]ASO20940.1 SnoaL-like domain protein [Actinoalloteichus hoggarensis]MBB5920871.1 uncharacterized protein (TIGR02246 family) [Actinoalloteichus hoggarensis]
MTTTDSTTVDDDTAAVRLLPQRIMDAWAAHDGQAFADVFTEDGTLILPGDVLLRGREEIGAYMNAAFAGPYQGTRVFGEPVAVKFLGAAVCQLLTRGGVRAPGEAEVAPERAVHASWLLVKQDDGRWLLTAYQNTPAVAP